MQLMKYIPKVLKIKKKKPTEQKAEQKRDLLKPTVRTKAMIKKLKESGLTDEEIKKLTG